MPRPPRDNIAGAVYHITARGNNFESIFSDDADRYVYLQILATTLRRFSIRLYAYVLMTNHVHLLLETLQPNISVTIHQLHGTYAKYVNRRHGRWGHLFGQRFFSKIITDDDHLLSLRPGPPIHSPAEFLALLGERPGSSGSRSRPS